MKKWHLVSKAELHKDHPVFMKRSGELATMGYFNAVLRDLLREISPKITARSFRPGLSTILARQGASQESLKSLGRWTSKAYLCYIKKGRANNWRNSYFQLQEAIKNNWCRCWYLWGLQLRWGTVFRDGKSASNSWRQWWHGFWGESHVNEGESHC